MQKRRVKDSLSIITLGIILLMGNFIKAQERLDGTYNNDKREYISPSNNVIANEFRDGLSPYRQGEFYGVIDTTGKIICQPKYYEMESYLFGVARITKKAEPWEITYGYINESGKEVLEPIFDDADDWFYRSLRFAEVLVVGQEGEFSVYNCKGKKLTSRTYRSVGDFHNDRARVYVDGKMGYINSKGKEVIPCVYDQVNDFGGSLSLVKNDNKFGWIDLDGKVVIPIEFDWAQNFIGGKAKVKKDGKMSYIDTKGDFIFTPDYESLGYYSEGLASAQKDGKWGFINANNEIVIPFDYDRVGNFRNGRSWVRKGDKWGHINTKGEVVTPLIYESSNDFSNSYNGDSLYSSVSLNGKYGKVGINGNLVIKCNYYGIDHFSDGVCKVRIIEGDKRPFGFVNDLGEEIIPCIYDQAERSSNGFIRLKKDNLWGLFNTKGEKLTPCKYHSIEVIDENKCELRIGRELIYVDKNGKQIKE